MRVTYTVACSRSQSWLPLSVTRPIAANLKRNDARLVLSAPCARNTFLSYILQVFAALSTVPLAMIQSTRQDLIAAAACNLIAAGISHDETQHAHTTVPHWRQVVDSGLKSKTVAVQEAAAGALAAVSRLVDCSAVLQRLVREFEGGSPQMQQSLARVLGVLDYAAHPHGMQDAVRCLLRMVDRKVGRALPFQTHINRLRSDGDW